MTARKFLSLFLRTPQKSFISVCLISGQGAISSGYVSWRNRLDILVQSKFRRYIYYSLHWKSDHIQRSWQGPLKIITVSSYYAPQIPNLCGILFRLWIRTVFFLFILSKESGR
jgi:hypothetical protein